jgi:hypothetical protein
MSSTSTYPKSAESCLLFFWWADIGLEAYDVSCGLIEWNYFQELPSIPLFEKLG